MAHLSFNVADRSYLSLIKKDIHRLVTEAGFPAKRVDEIDIIVAEITSNLIKHGKNGELLASIQREHDQPYLELIALDKGPGMNDPQRMMEDGVSTKGTLGHGLGAIKRLSHHFELYSIRTWGTILLARVFSKEPVNRQRSSRTVFRAVAVAKPGEEVCGDGWYVEEQGQVIKAFIGDGLGHGPEAHKAVAKAAAIFASTPDNSPVSLIREIHQGVKKTRGLVGAILIFNSLKKTGILCGVGNIAIKSFSNTEAKNHVSYNGIIGMNIPGTMKDQELNVTDAGQYIVMCSDGIRSQWDISRFPGILKFDPSVLAAAIYKDYSRRTDDMSVLVGKLN